MTKLLGIDSNIIITLVLIFHISRFSKSILALNSSKTTFLASSFVGLFAFTFSHIFAHKNIINILIFKNSSLLSCQSVF